MLICDLDCTTPGDAFFHKRNSHSNHYMNCQGVNKILKGEGAALYVLNLTESSVNFYDYRNFENIY